MVHNSFWVVQRKISEKISPKQRNICIGSPVFSNGMFQSEIRAPFLESHPFDTGLPFRCFSVNETDL